MTARRPLSMTLYEPPGKTFHGPGRQPFAHTHLLSRKEPLVKKQIVLTAVAKDRPGLINRVSSLIRSNGGNIELQRSIKLAGEFAIIALFSLKEGIAAEDVLATIGRIEDGNLNISARLANTSENEEGPRAILIVEGADRPGIVEALSLFLVEQGFNVESMDYTVVNAPFHGTPLFNANLKMLAPPDLQVQQLRKKMVDLERDLDIQLLVRYPVA